MKKIISISLSLILIFCISLTSFAAREYPARLVSRPLEKPLLLPESMRSAGFSSFGIQPYAIIGDDDTRWQVDQDEAESWPYNMVVAVFAKYTGGGERVILTTGFMIDDYTVLTAGHCINNPTLGFATEIEVVPGYTGNGYAPFGRFTAESFHIPNNYSPGSVNDYGVICFSENIGDVVGHFGWTTLRDPVDNAIEVTGYPQSKQGQMWTSWDFITEVSPKNNPSLIHYTLDTEPGNSGSPVFIADCQAVGIHISGDSTKNNGVFLTNQVMDWVQPFFG